MHPVVVGLGGNLGDVPGAFARARAALAGLSGVSVGGCSGLWRTAPVGPDAAQPWFWNAALVLDPGGLGPRELLTALLAIEATAGRRRGAFADGPRPLDLDLLLWGGLRLTDAGPPRVTLPHPRLATRAFALAPLCEVAGPDAWIPGAGTAGVLLARARAAGQRIQRLREHWPLPAG